MKNNKLADVPESFVEAIRKRRAEIGIPLRQLALKADMDPATLSRILSNIQKLPSNEVILRLAEVLKIQPPQRLLVEAGRIPWQRPQMKSLLRAASELTEDDLDKVMKVVEGLRKKRSNEEGQESESE